MRTVMMNMANRLKAEQMEKMKQQGAENLKAGEAFLLENAGKDGVNQTGSVGCKERLGGLLKYYYREAA